MPGGVAWHSLAGNVTSAEAVPPEVISRWNNQLIHSGSLSPGFNMFLASGAYTITAKLTAHNTGAAAIDYTCLISAAGGADTDNAEGTLPANGKQDVFLNVVHNFTSTGQLSFACTKPGGTAQVRMLQVKITAIKVNSLDNQPF
ncbi:hypothetical protein SAMN05444920_103649 [Nonomuraea solani]|uniref:Uncharacterized protein n=1 Tax=Nonomuraea solani TaxID=1144553 RepID=A0A1H6BU34_9ACTN|nr:hypothetical protein [Nonomuraea solani]SEG64152.1 hypothetical protein SAMN05444920_103649 [Nonomuraea solani]